MPSRLNGLDIRVSSFLGPRPKLKLSLNVPLSEEFRSDMDRWLLEMFGASDDALVIGDIVFVSTQVMDQLRRAQCKPMKALAA